MPNGLSPNVFPSNNHNDIPRHEVYHVSYLNQIKKVARTNFFIYHRIRHQLEKLSSASSFDDVRDFDGKLGTPKSRHPCPIGYLLTRKSKVFISFTLVIEILLLGDFSRGIQITLPSRSSPSLLIQLIILRFC